MRGPRFGVIGVGSMGKNHARLLSTFSGVNLVGVADQSFALAQEVASYHHTKAFETYQQLLPEVDAVCLVTPTQTHFEIGSECLNQGKHLLVEKPFTGDSSLAKILVALAKEKNLILAVGMIERYNPTFQKLLKEIKGEKIIGVDLQRLSPFPERISDTDVVFDMMIHDLDLLRLIVKDEIEFIKAKGEKLRTKMLDRVVTTITYKTGIVTRAEANRVFGIKSRKIAVTTEKYLVEADLLNKRIYLRDFASPTPTTVLIKPADQLTEELKNFVLAIKGKRAVITAGEDALKTLLLTEEVKKAC